MSTSIAPSGYGLDGRDVSALTPLRLPPRSRHRRLIWLLLTVLVPVVVAGTYLYGYAADQYVTEFRFSVRHQMPLRMDPGGGSASASLLGSGGSPLAVINDSQIVIQYLKSRQIIEDIAATGIDLDAIYADQDKDFLAHLRRGATVEDRLRYWRGMVDPFFDMTTGIVSVQVRAFHPADAMLIATRTLALAEKLVNDISERAHTDVLAYARQEVNDSEAKLKAAQVALATYRNGHAVLFPEMEATSSTSVGGIVEQHLIEAKTAFNAQLAQGVSRDALQMRMLANRIAAMETELRGVNGRLTRSDGDTSLASVLSEYSVLRVSEEIATKVYERALISLQEARHTANEQAVYLAAFVRPGLPQDSQYPVRWRIMVETALIAFVAWCLSQLVYHAVRDHID
jgi:capsular polysaccharide transport system permease protein